MRVAGDGVSVQGVMGGVGIVSTLVSHSKRGDDISCPRCSVVDMTNQVGLESELRF